MFNNHPKIDVKPNEFDRRLIRCGWLVVALNFILVLAFYFQLPETVPIHFNLKGEADGFGSKNNIWIIPIFNLVLYLGMTLLIKKMKPWNYNYPTKVTETNASKLYSMCIRMMAVINFSIALLFLWISAEMLLSIQGNHALTLPILFAFVAFITLYPFYIIFKMFKVPKK